MRKRSMADLNRISVAEFRVAEKLPVIIVLDNIRSLNNIGSVFRTADAFRLEGLFLCGITATPPHREIHKTALGATDSVNWRYFESTTAAVNHLAENGWRIVAVEQVEEGTMLQAFNPPPGEKLAFVFGNEINGVDDDVLALCHEAIEIPQSGTKHSINVSVAVGIVIWDIFMKMKKSLPFM
jgi:23S rRNA (guanosine2251-2'-O)-methyltransferase